LAERPHVTLLQAHGLDITIGRQVVCAGLELGIKAGEMWAILGGNGVGKSTLLFTLAGLRAPDAGLIALSDIPIAELSPRKLAQRRAVLFQDSETTFPTTVLDTVVQGRFPHQRSWWGSTPEDLAAAHAALAAVDLNGFERRNLDTLSGGEKRRVAIAAVLAQAPSLYLLDEPGNHLDIKHHIATLALMQEMVTNNARAAVIVMHDINMAVRFCDHALLIFGQGRTLAGSVKSVATESHLSELYGHPLRQIPAIDRTAFLPD
jgi:iron complex transport system ATP-binding protein